jgi:hypothetical protein
LRLGGGCCWVAVRGPGVLGVDADLMRLRERGLLVGLADREVVASAVGMLMRDLGWPRKPAIAFWKKSASIENRVHRDHCR